MSQFIIKKLKIIKFIYEPNKRIPKIKKIDFF